MTIYASIIGWQWQLRFVEVFEAGCSEVGARQVKRNVGVKEQKRHRGTANSSHVGPGVDIQK